ncbi:WD40-repeat-containing domain protein [Gloeopeniophorella convolvens]|nr:WD40-repeat-containing domain protein [Gloeopeniophorella convolvens]
MLASRCKTLIRSLPLPIMDYDENLPWFRDRQLDPPFKLVKCIKNPRGREFRFACLFPWTMDSLDLLVNMSPEYPISGWCKIIEFHAGMLAVGNAEEVYLVDVLSPPGGRRNEIHLKPELSPIAAVAWAFQPSPPAPVLVVAMSGIVCIYSLTGGQRVGCWRGHGGTITSIAVHPSRPCLVCTTSSDQTARIYDLERFPEDPSVQLKSNPFWLPGSGPSRGGAPHGLRSSEPEETGMGRCTTVYVGGRSGGHLAAVSCAAFHPTFPLIATGGMDRVVKIWRIPDYGGQLMREDKPLYSSTLIHRSPVASVSWLGEDMLLTHSLPTAFLTHKTLLREQTAESDDDGRPDQEWSGGAGRIVLFRWLALNRFFPPSETTHQSIQRGCASDYQESSSFTVVTSIPLPYYPDVPHFRVFGDTYHDHIILVGHHRTIRLLNASHMPGLEMSEFPDDTEQFSPGLEVQSRLRAEESQDSKLLHSGDWVYGLGWCIDLRPKFADGEGIQATDMGLGGRMIVAIGSRGSIWVWRMEI